MPKITEAPSAASPSRTTDIGRGAPPSSPEKGWRLALNVPDLTRVPEFIRGSLLAGKVAKGAEPIRVDKQRPDETAVELSCDLLTAALVADVLRSNDRKTGDHPTRVYLRRREGAWIKLPHSAVLTEVVNGKSELSAKWFPDQVEMVSAAPLRPQRLD